MSKCIFLKLVSIHSSLWPFVTQSVLYCCCRCSGLIYWKDQNFSYNRYVHRLWQRWGDGVSRYKTQTLFCTSLSCSVLLFVLIFRKLQTCYLIVSTRDQTSDYLFVSSAANRNPASKTTTEQDSEGMFLYQSLDVSRRLVQDQASKEDSGSLVPHQASIDPTDPNSEEEVTVEEVWVSNRSSVGTKLQRRATSGRVPGLNGSLAPGQSREQLDWDSLERNNGRPAPQGDRGDTDNDGKTQELFSVLPKRPRRHMSVSVSRDSWQ